MGGTFAEVRSYAANRWRGRRESAVHGDSSAFPWVQAPHPPRSPFGSGDTPMRRPTPRTCGRPVRIAAARARRGRLSPVDRVVTAEQDRGAMFGARWFTGAPTSEGAEAPQRKT